MNKYMTVQEVARAACVSCPAVIGAINRGELRADKLGKVYAIHEDSAEQYISRILKSKRGSEGVGARAIFSVAVPVGIADKLGRVAAENGVSRNQYIVDAIVAAMEKEA